MTQNLVRFLALACIAWPTTLAGQPAPACPAAEARQFDFWVGEWDILNRQSPP